MYNCCWIIEGQNLTWVKKRNQHLCSYISSQSFFPQTVSAEHSESFAMRWVTVGVGRRWTVASLSGFTCAGTYKWCAASSVRMPKELQPPTLILHLLEISTFKLNQTHLFVYNIEKKIYVNTQCLRGYSKNSAEYEFVPSIWNSVGSKFQIP